MLVATEQKAAKPSTEGFESSTVRRKYSPCQFLNKQLSEGETMTVMMPWGLRQATEDFAKEPPLYETIEFDPDTQLTHFRDGAGAIVDMGQKVTVTMSKGGGGDGSSTSKSVADDSQND